MMTFNEARRQLEELEKKWFTRLTSRIPFSGRPTLAYGDIQFFSIENASPAAPTDQEYHIVVAVGINYGQLKPNAPTASFTKWEPHVFNLNAKNIPRSRVEDCTSPLTRKALDAALDAFGQNQNRKIWQQNGYAAPELTINSFQ